MGLPLPRSRDVSIARLSAHWDLVRRWRSCEAGRFLSGNTLNDSQIRPATGGRDACGIHTSNRIIQTKRPPGR